MQMTQTQAPAIAGKQPERKPVDAAVPLRERTARFPAQEPERKGSTTLEKTRVSLRVRHQQRLQPVSDTEGSLPAKLNPAAETACESVRRLSPSWLFLRRCG